MSGDLKKSRTLVPEWDPLEIPNYPAVAFTNPELASTGLTEEQAIAKYEEGMKLSQVCSQKLETAQKKIEILIKSDKGKPKPEPFSAEEEFVKAEPKKAKKQKAKREEEELLF